MRLTFLICYSLVVAFNASGYAYAQLSQEDFTCQKLNTCFYDPTDSYACGNSQDSAINIVDSTNSNDRLVNIYNWLLAQKKQDGTSWLNDVQAAAVVGNIAHESGGDPQNTQTGYMPDRTTDPTQVSYDMRGNQGGWGLIQWTPAKKVIDIQKSSGITGDIAELKTQVGLVWWHMNNTSPTGKQNMLAGFPQTNMSDAVIYYEQTMEGAGIKDYESRINKANLALKYKKSGMNYASSSTGCQCTMTGNEKITVVLDPGHSGLVNGQDQQGKVKDPETGLYIGDSSNPTERKQVWSVAQKIKAKLESKNYKVVLTKEKEDSYVSLKQRALIANKANAAIAVSIHTDSGNFGSAEKSWVTSQKVGGYRINDNAVKTTFGDAGVATKSQEYARAILETRKAAGEPGTNEHDIVFDGRQGLSGGNLSIVQLFSKVPWVYNETGQTGFNEDKYAAGIAEGIIKALPAASDDTAVSKGCTGAVSGDIVQTAVNYAWPDFHSAPYTTKKASYQAAVEKAQKEGKYVGGLQYPGVDCGGFVTRVMQDSGADPEYGRGGNTIFQLKHMVESGKYVEQHPASTADMQPGDIAINSDHTYMYVGSGLNDPDSGKEFETSVASASVSFTGNSWRAPMAGYEQPAARDYRWFRLK